MLLASKRLFVLRYLAVLHALAPLAATALFAGTLVGCGPPGAGAACDPKQTTPCADGLVCAADAKGKTICSIPPGGACTTAGSAGDCQYGSTCKSYTDWDGTASTICVGQEGGWCDPANDYCDTGLRCAYVQGGSAACYPPIHFRGKVFDSGTSAPIAGAHVVGVNDERFVVTNVAVTDAAGNYDLEVAAPRDPATSNAPASANYTLRVDADGYQTFPSGIRQALPINTSLAQKDANGAWVVQSAITNVAMIRLADQATPRFKIEGDVKAGRNNRASVLAVAEASATTGYSGVSDLAGHYTIFNVPAASYAVKGYKADLQLTPANATVVNANLTGVDLVESTHPLTEVTGTVQIVNAPGGSKTSVVLVVESTFNDVFKRGEVPSGLRAPRSGPPDVTGAWSIKGVPDGKYVVLAAFENDLLVRDPDTNIAGTQIVHITVSGGGTYAVQSSFKITEALAVVKPGADLPEPATSPFSLEWVADASAAFYTVQVYDAYGSIVWQIYDLVTLANNIPPPNTSTVVVPYAGPALTPGMYYQFIAMSWRAPGGNNPAPISATEDLRGVFYAP